MNPSTRTFRTALAVSSILASATAIAYDLPTLNLGSTSFLDGAAGPPGWYTSEYLQNYNANHLKDNNGTDLPLPQQKIQATVLINQLIYMSPQKLGDATMGIQFLLPAVLDVRTEDGLGGAALSGKTGLGDLAIGPFLQFAPIMGATGPVLMHRVEFTVMAPTGRYDRAAAVSPGSNFWSFNPHWAATWWVNEKVTASVRLHYLWNGKNSEPAAGFGPNVSKTQAGQAAHANWTLDYAVNPQLRAGLNGYWLRQTTDTKADGVAVSGRKERVWAIGPGAVYSFSQRDHVFFNAYFEQDARNRSEGTRLQARWVHAF